MRQSVERLLLHNKGIKSVRRVDNVVSVAGFDIPMPKSVILPETYCDKNGNNKIAPTNDPVNFPSYYNLPDHMTTYYWEPTEVVKNAAESIGLGFISSSILGDGIDLVCDGLRDSGVEVLEYLGSKCLKKPEAIEEEPILHRNGFCLRKVSYENENNYCTIAVFENPSRNTDQYFMAFGKERYADISRDLKELGVEDSVQIYLDTFEKCK